MRGYRVLMVIAAVIAACGGVPHGSHAAGKTRALPPHALTAYHRALLQVAECLSLTKTVAPTVRAMQGRQHIHPLNIPGVQGSRERDALTALDKRLAHACGNANVVDVPLDGTLPTEATMSFHRVVIALGAWLAQTVRLQLAMQRCEYLGDYNDVRDVRCVPPLMRALGRYLGSYRSAQSTLRAFRAYWHLVA